MDNTITLKCPRGTVRVQLGTSGEPWFCVVDVCLHLGYFNSRDAVGNWVDAEDRMLRKNLDAAGHNRMMQFVNVFGLLALIVGSRRKDAIEFKHWLIYEAMPHLIKLAMTNRIC